jgi:hypothetical protein
MVGGRRKGKESPAAHGGAALKMCFHIHASLLDIDSRRAKQSHDATGIAHNAEQ